MRKHYHYALSALAILVSILFILPYYWGFIGSLKEVGVPPPVSIDWLLSAPNWDNYLTLFRIVPMLDYTRNSIVVVLVAVPVSVLISALGGFALSQIKQQRRWLLWSISMLLIPAASVWMLRFQLLRMIGLVDTLWALILPAFFGTTPLFVLLFYWSFRRVKSEIFESARLDGASAWQAILWLGLPLAKPTVACVTILTFITYWNDFMSPVLYVSRPQAYTLPIGLELVKQLDTTNWPIILSAAFYMSVPCMILFVVLQRYFFNAMLQQEEGKSK